MNINDNRWGGYIPWFLRDESLPGSGDFGIFFKRVGQCLATYFRFEHGHMQCKIFGARLETESLQRYQHNADQSLAPQIGEYFDSGLAKIANRISAREALYKFYSERLGVLEIILRMLPTEVIDPIRRDIRRALAEAEIPLDLRGTPPAFVPLDEPLLQREVIDRLLPRLEARFPHRAKELITAYHDLISREKPGDIFLDAFGTLEGIAREITGDDRFMFDAVSLHKHFGNLHKTVHITMIKLAAHRGDNAGHGRADPGAHELRYLLFDLQYCVAVA
ncbi:hypothetical protein [Acidiferrobacter sp.]|jgi:hypothetical protein|uniref:hypothetical protein n=1 Tax=Acidiferrobacter sp. TaxID=1872107 RepID=UPI002309AFC2|nr:hypothetical protein [Acidiferrobacter sp.]MDA8191415.1 hypothetical protein [Gammaproteobacteria bacterium]